MASVTVKSVSGKDAGTIELDEAIFGVQPNVPVMHQVVTAQLAARRAGTQSTKTRAEVSGGGKKPFKQKGTGNARQGSTRAPHFSGGGVALGPKPRSYAQKTPKKMVRLALRSALSDRANGGKIVVVDEWGFAAPKTKDALAALAKLGVTGKALVVVDIDDTNTIKSFLNLPEVQLIERAELNAYDVLCSDVVVFSRATLPTAEASESSTARPRRTAAAPAASADSPAKPTPRPTKAAAAPAAAAVPAADDAPAAPQAFAATATTEQHDAPEAKPVPAGAVAANEDGSSPDPAYTIKGNGDSGLYHRPGTAFFNRTVAEFWFRSEADAEAAGFQLPPSQRGDAAGTSEGVHALADIADAPDEPSAERIGDGTGTLPKGAVAANEDGTSPYTTYTIKGNSDSGYYHRPGTPFYERTKAEFWFKTEEAAREAGFELPPSQRDEADKEN